MYVWVCLKRLSGHIRTWGARGGLGVHDSSGFRFGGSGV